MDNIGVINKTCQLAGIERLNPDNVDLNDEKVWKSIRDDTTLIFQWESNSAQAYLKRFMSDETIRKVKAKTSNFSYLKWFSFGNGLLRPACASYRDEVSGGDFYDNGFKELNEFLAPEAGRVCMQETIMMFLVKFCGYTQAESDNVRRAIAKKRGTATLLPEIEQRFIDYSSTHYDITKEKCQEVIKPFLQIILDASSYGFSWNHSDAYSAIGYISGYLRYYYPLEFLTAAFNTFTDKEEKITAITEYAKKIGIKIHNVSFGHSKSGYNMDKSTNTIYKGMESIKYMNASVSDTLYELSQTKKYDNFLELLEDFPGDARQLDILIRLGYFSEFGLAKTLLKTVEYYDKYKCTGATKQFKKDNLPIEAIPFIEKCAVKETDKTYVLDVAAVKSLLREIVSTIPQEDLPLKEKLSAESEYLGYISTTIPDANGNAFVTAIEPRGANFRISFYDLTTGEFYSVKLKKRMYQVIPINVGTIISYRLGKECPWYKDEDGKWQQDTTKEKQPFLAWYGANHKWD